MRAYALLTAAQSVVLLAAFLIFISKDMMSWESAAYSYFLSYAVIGFILVIYLRDYIKLRFERPLAKKIMHYSLLALPGALAGSFMGVDRILINKFMTTADVGIYNAYFLPSITLATLLWTIINAAFFPYASKSEDKLALLLKINKATPYLAAFARAISASIRVDSLLSLWAPVSVQLGNCTLFCHCSNNGLFLSSA